MTAHPLTAEDYHLIQDYMVTKVALLLTAQAGLPEWRHEIDAMQSQSGEYWQRRNALLFDYTLGRFLAAALSRPPEPDATPLPPAEQFVRDFVSTVLRQDYVTAELLWADANTATGESGTRLPSTTTLVLRLGQLARHVDLPATFASLPPEFYPPQYVS